MNYDDFLMMNASKFPTESIPLLRHRLEETAPESRYYVLSAAYKTPGLALLLSFLFGILGVDRFYVGNTGLGIAKLCATFLTAGIVGTIWWFVDLFLIVRACKVANYQQAMQMLAYAKPRDTAAQTVDAEQEDDDFDDF